MVSSEERIVRLCIIEWWVTIRCKGSV